MGWHELIDSRETHVEQTAIGTTVDLKFIADGSDNDMIIRSTVEANAPQRYLNLWLQSYDIEPLGGGIWNVVCHYGLTDPDDWTFNFDTTGATTHITQSLATSGSYGNAPNLKGAINYDGEHVAGADIQIPRYSWNETHTIEAVLFTPAYRLILFNLTSRYNDATFRGFASGEVQFQGATGAQRGDHPVEITYYFEASPNLGSHSIGDVTVTSKRGWDLEWVRYKTEADATTKRLTKVPDAVYVEQIFESGDFSTLGIGIA